MTNDYNKRAGDEEVVIVETTEVQVARQDVERTRASIGETLSEIKDKINPDEMMEKAKHAATDVVHEATERVKDTARDVAHSARESAKEATKGAVSGAVEPIKHAGQDIGERIKSNPLPLLLIGAAAWYFYGRGKDNKVQTQEDIYTSPGMAGAYDYEHDRGMMEKAKEKLSGTMDTAKEKVSGGMELAREKASHAAERAGEMGSGFVETVKTNPMPFLLIGAGAAMLYNSSRSNGQPKDDSINYYGDRYPEGTEERSLKDRAREKASEAKHRVGEFASSAKDKTARQYERGKAKVTETYNTNPLVYGAIALGAGAALAVMLPQTEWERRTMGDASDRLKERASEKVRELGHDAKEVAKHSLDAAKETAKDETKSRFGKSEGEDSWPESTSSPDNQGTLPSESRSFRGTMR